MGYLYIAQNITNEQILFTHLISSLITVISEVDKGSIFTLTFPLVK